MLSKFDADNDYLADWTEQKKIQTIRNWKIVE
jgi:hypothetical protein